MDDKIQTKKDKNPFLWPIIVPIIKRKANLLLSMKFDEL